MEVPTVIETLLILVAAIGYADAGTCWNISHPACTWTPTAVLRGRLSQLGQFHACLDVYREQYCVAEVRLSEGNSSSELWRAIEVNNRLRTRYKKDVLRWGVCVPRLMGATAVREGLEAALAPAAVEQGVAVRVNLNAAECQVAGDKPIEKADLVVGGIVLFLILMMTVATTTEGCLRLQEKKPKSKGLELLLAFSIISNWRRLSGVSHRDDDIRCIQGIRFINLSLVIMGHAVLLIQAGPMLNHDFIEESYKEIFRMAIFNGHLITSTFFVISGFLLAYIFLNEVSKEKNFRVAYILAVFIYRCLRLTPPYALVIAVASTIVRHMGHGPLWHQFVDWDWNNCRNHWWTNILYVNNYVHADDTCLLHSWYLAADTQLFLLCLFVMTCIWKWPRSAIPLLSAIILISIGIPMLQTYSLQLDPTMLVLPGLVKNVSYDRTYLYSYAPGHMNISPYIIGVTAGYAFYMIKKNNTRIPVWIRATIWLLALTLPLGLTLSAFPFYQEDYKYDVTVAAVYAGLHRAAFATGMAVTICGCALGYGWFANMVLSWKPFQPLGRLTYSAYLVHFTLQKVKMATVDREIFVNESAIIGQWMADLVQAYLLGLLLCLAVELPTNAIWNALLPTDRRSREAKARNEPTGADAGVDVVSHL